MEGTNRAFHVIVIIHTFDGKNVAEFIVCHEKTRIRHNIYDKALRVLLVET